MTKPSTRLNTVILPSLVLHGTVQDAHTQLQLQVRSLQSIPPSQVPRLARVSSWITRDLGNIRSNYGISPHLSKVRSRRRHSERLSGRSAVQPPPLTSLAALAGPWTFRLTGRLIEWKDGTVHYVHCVQDPHHDPCSSGRGPSPSATHTRHPNTTSNCWPPALQN